MKLCRLLWVILRKTYGWHKKEDYIALSQFQYFTGLNTKHINRELLMLEERKIITVKHTSGKTSLYQFQKDYELWVNPEPLTKELIALSSNQRMVLPLNYGEVLPSNQFQSTPQLVDELPSNQGDTKEIKENIQKMEEIFDYFRLQTNQPNIILNNDRRNLIKKRLDDRFTVDQIKIAIDNFSKDTWGGRKRFMDIRYCIGIIKEIDKLEGWINWEEPEKDSFFLMYV